MADWITNVSFFLGSNVLCIVFHIVIYKRAQEFGVLTRAIALLPFIQLHLRMENWHAIWVGRLTCVCGPVWCSRDSKGCGTPEYCPVACSLLNRLDWSSPSQGDPAGRHRNSLVSVTDWTALNCPMWLYDGILVMYFTKTSFYNSRLLKRNQG